MARICMLVTSEYHRDPRVQKEAKLAHEAGHEVTVICRSYEGETMPYRVVTFDTQRRSNRGFKYLERVSSIVLLVHHTLANHPDIIHANDLDTLPAGYIASRLCGAKLLYDSHELWTEMADIGSVGKKVALFIEKFICRRADIVVAVNRYRAQIMAQLHDIPEPLVVMNTPFYVAPDLLMPGDWTTPFKQCGKRIVLYQGGYSKSMGLSEAIMAANYLPENIVLVFRGFGPAEDEMKSLIKSEGLSERVVIIPPVSMNAMVISAVGADLGLALYKPVNQNNLYAAPNKVFEYMMAGVPCVGSDLPYIREILCSCGVGEVFRPGDSQDMARVICELLDTPEKLEVMKKRCLDQASQFCWEAEGAKLLKAYDQIFNDSSKTHTQVGKNESITLN